MIVRSSSLGLLAALSLAFVAPATAQPAPAAQAPVQDADAEAKRLFEEGKRALDEGRHTEAAELFQRAYALSGRTSLLYNVAYALDKAGRSRDALLLSRDARTQLRNDEDATRLNDLIARLESVVAEDRTARDYFNVAQQRLKEGNYSEAAIGFGEAYKLSGFPELLLNQARALAKAGDLPSALSLTNTALEKVAADSPLRVTATLLRAQLEREVNLEARKRGRLRVVTMPADALVRVDGQPVGHVAENVSEGVFSTGPHQLDVSRQGFVGITSIVDLNGGELTTRTVELQYAACDDARQRRVRSAPEFCCWPGQDVRDGVCVGRPQCPSGLQAEGELCAVPPPALTQASVSQREAREYPSHPALYAVNIDWVWLPFLVDIMSSDPFGGDVGYDFAMMWRTGVRVLPWLSTELAYAYGYRMEIASNDAFDISHTTYLLVGAHNKQIRQKKKRDLIIRTGIIPYARTASLGSSDILYERKGWGIPLQAGVNFQRGRHFGVGIEAHLDWLQFADACESGFGRPCVSGGSMLRFGLALSLLWSAP